MFKTYFLIFIGFILASFASTACIHQRYMSLYIKELNGQAESLAEYAKDRIITYKSYKQLMKYWLDGLDISSFLQDNYWANQPDLPEISDEQFLNLSEDERCSFARICYTRIAYGFDMMYTSFGNQEIYCLGIKDGEFIPLFNGDDDVGNNYFISDGTFETDSERYSFLADIDENELLRKGGKHYTSSNYFSYCTPITDDNGLIGVVIWEKDWSEVRKNIFKGAVAIGTFNLFMLFVIAVVLMKLFYKYHKEKVVSALNAERTRAEMSVCTRIQQSRNPDLNKKFNGRKDFEISAFIQSAKEVGGDFYDCFMTDDCHLGLIIGDVSDKGIPAAMFMMSASSLLKSELKKGISPEQALKSVNEQLSEQNDTEMFVTIWAATINLITGECKVVNAGHENPFVKRNGKAWEILKYKHMMACAVTPRAVYRQHDFRLDEGDMFFVYTDGITDAKNKEGLRFGESGILTSLNNCTEIGAEESTACIMNDINEFSADTEQFDDITMLCFRFLGTDSINLKAEDGELGKALDFIRYKAEKAGLSKKDISDLRLASEEIFGNIIDYAYEDTVGDVIIKAISNGEKFSVEFTDHGRRFDPTQKENPDIAEKVSEQQIGGLGVYLVKKLMDDVSYRYEDANILTITKIIRN